jgi:hypothetical protein
MKHEGALLKNDHDLFIFGLIFFIMEAFKQIILIKRGYNIWFFPFQLCSIPIYLCLLYGLIHKPECALTWLADYGFLGGFAALIVHRGFTNTGILYVTIHGYLWHSLMIVLSIYLVFVRRIDLSWKAFGKSVLLFAVMCVLAEIINVIGHPFGDCDMFYITPYHMSSQPVFCNIDRLIGRPLGIIVYLGTIIFFSAFIHELYHLMRTQLA